MEEILVREGERADDTGFGGYRVIQGSGFRYGVDAVLVAGFAAERLNAGIRRSAGNRRAVRVCDLGSGNGIIPIILCHKVPDCKVMGIETDPDAWSRSVRSAALNGLSERIRFLNADVLDVTESILAERTGEDGSGIEGTFDAVVTNPPYFRKGAAILNGAGEKARARHEITAGLTDFLTLAALLLKPNGSLFMIHRPDRLVDIFTEMRACGIEPKEMQFVLPRRGEAANLVLIHGIRGAGPELRILPEQAVHGDGNGYTDWIEELYERK